MEKISSILPANARVTTVDLKNSGVARSGMPSFGREVGVSSVVERAQAQELAAKAGALQGEQLSQRSQVLDPRADIVKRMSDGFFAKKAQQYEKEKAEVPMLDDDDKYNLADISPSETYNASSRYNSAPTGVAASVPAPDEAAETAMSGDENMAISGQHLDVMV